MPDANKIALIVGMDEFQNPNLSPLSPCKKDAQDMSEILSKLDYTIYGNSPLIGSNLDKEYGFTKVRDSIVDFFDSAIPSQTLLFYYSGHGIEWANEIFLSTPQINPSKPIAKGISFSELTKMMSNCRSKRIVGIIDACYAGAANLPTSELKKSSNDHASRALAAYDRIYDNVPHGEGVTLLLSSQAYEPSVALKDNSLYTKYLLEGLKGIKFEVDSRGRKIPYSGTLDDYGNVTPKLLHDYVYNKVASQTKQVPKIKSEQSSEIVIAEHPEIVQDTKIKISSEKRSKIRKMLLDLGGDELISDSILSRALDVIKLDSNQISGKEKQQWTLLEQLLQNEIKIGSFTEHWLKLEYAQPPPISSSETRKSDEQSTRSELLTDQSELDKEKRNTDNVSNLNEKGYNLNLAGKYEEAIKLLNKALQIDPRFSAAVVNKSWALNELGRYDEALRLADEALEIDPRSTSALVNKGFALDSLGKHNEAIKYYDDALEIDPRNTAALANKGFTLFSLGEYNEAIKYYDDALEIDPQNARILAAKNFIMKEAEKSKQKSGKSKQKDPVMAKCFNCDKVVQIKNPQKIRYMKTEAYEGACPRCGRYVQRYIG